ncbi:MAG: DNA polymerase III subunit alpha [bacterium]
MQPAGTKTLAYWREAGEWWNGEPNREVHRFIDAKGIRREIVTPIETPQEEPPESSVRIRRLRDEKVRLATGAYVPNSFGAASVAKPSGVLLHAVSAYALSRGTMLAGEIPAFAAEKGYGTVLIADPFSLTGAREFCKTAYYVGVKPLIGATLEMADGGELVLVAKCAIGYRSLSRLITECHLNEPRLYPLCNWERLEHHNEGLLCLTGGSLGPVDLRLIRRDFEGAEKVLDRLIGLYGKRDVFVQIERSYLPWQMAVEQYLRQLSKEKDVVAVAGGPVVHGELGHFPAHDVLVCVDALCLVEEVEGRKPTRDPTQPQAATLPRRSLNAERYLRAKKEMAALYQDSRELLQNCRKVADRCSGNVLPERVRLPRFCENEEAVFTELVWVKARERCNGISPELKKRLDREINRMVRLKWARHFLIAWEMCEWARSEGILFSGRGSVVDSMVAYCLGISRINAFDHDLHFDRFLGAGDTKRPDIDIDFEAARREDVRQHLVQKYGSDHVATVAAIGTYGTRGILREVGKVMGIPEEAISFLSKRLHGSVTPGRLESALEERPELRDSNVPKDRYFWAFKLRERLMDLPRNLRAHSSGVVLSDIPIADTVPVQLSGADGVKIIQWDKRSSKQCFDKYDVLCLRGNDVLGGTARNVPGLDVTDIPIEDPEVFRAMRAGQLIGVPQSASPAMRQAHIRIKTNCFRDAGIVQAAIRPGVGGAVKLNEFVARRNGKLLPKIDAELDRILEPTMGIVVFQEQIDQLLETYAGYDADQAEDIRDAIQRHYNKGYTDPVCSDIITRIMAKGHSADLAHKVYEMVAGFKGYGFAQGHALSFAEVSVRSIYCQQNFPAPYFAALLDAQPAGYYGPVTIANEARSRGAVILPPDFNRSEENFAVEDVMPRDDPKILVPRSGIRVPLKQTSGLSKEMVQRALNERPYSSFFDFVAKVAPARDELETLVLIGAFDSFHPNRRALLWAVPQALAHGAAVRKSVGCLPFGIDDPPIPTGVEDFNAGEKAIYERRLLGLDIDRHLMAFERERVSAKGGLTSAQASCLKTSERVFVVGNPIRLRFPPTQSGKRVMFFDLEDETGLLNVTCFDDVYQRYGHKVICNPYITLWGEAQNRDGHIAFLAHQILTYKPTMESVTDPALLPIVTGDFLMK